MNKGHPSFLALAVTIAAVCAVLSIGSASADSTVAMDDFESGGLAGGLGWITGAQSEVASWITLGDVTATTDGGPHQGSWHMRVGASGTATRRTDVTGESGVRLQFQARHEGSGSPGDGIATLTVQADGLTPQVLHTWTVAEAGQTYASHDFDLDGLGVTPAGELALTFTVIGGPDARLFIDELSVIETAPQQPTDAATATAPIVLDSEFDDWDGHAFISEGFGDSTGGPVRDLHELYWANNVDEQVNYHMIRRHAHDGLSFTGPNGQAAPAWYLVHIDTNDNGVFTEAADRLVEVTYHPRTSDGRVKVVVRRAHDRSIVSFTDWEDWGETRLEGGLRAEFAVSWADLGIELGDVTRMYVDAYTGVVKHPVIKDRLPDGNADVQWSPASILGPWLLTGAFAVGIGVVWYTRGRRAWLRG